MYKKAHRKLLWDLVTRFVTQLAEVKHGLVKIKHGWVKVKHGLVKVKHGLVKALFQVQRDSISFCYFFVLILVAIHHFYSPCKGSKLQNICTCHTAGTCRMLCLGPLCSLTLELLISNYRKITRCGTDLANNLYNKYYL